MAKFSEDDIVFTSLRGEIVKAKVVLVWHDKSDLPYSCHTLGSNESFDATDESIFDSEEDALVYQVVIT